MFLNLFRKDDLPESKVVRDEVAQKLCDILFPDPIEENRGGHTFIVDHSVDSNLLAAILDLEDDISDETTLKTLRAVLEKLRDARDLLSANYKIDSDAEYVIVESR